VGSAGPRRWVPRRPWARMRRPPERPAPLPAQSAASPTWRRASGSKRTRPSWCGHRACPADKMRRSVLITNRAARAGGDRPRHDGRGGPPCAKEGRRAARGGGQQQQPPGRCRRGCSGARLRRCEQSFRAAAAVSCVVALTTGGVAAPTPLVVPEFADVSVDGASLPFARAFALTPGRRRRGGHRRAWQGASVRRRRLQRLRGHHRHGGCQRRIRRGAHGAQAPARLPVRLTAHEQVVVALLNGETSEEILMRVPRHCLEVRLLLALARRS
jgi:hypothetical protein